MIVVCYCCCCYGNVGAVRLQRLYANSQILVQHCELHLKAGNEILVATVRLLLYNTTNNSLVRSKINHIYTKKTCMYQ